MILVARRQETGVRRQESAAGRRRGLSIIEVLLASGIFLMAVVAICRLVDMGTDRETDARLSTQAARLAQTRLASVEAGETPLTATQGAFDGTDAHWTWQLTSEAAGPPNLYLITVTVSCQYRGRPFELSVAQMMLDPNAVGTAAAAARPEAATDATTTPTTGGME